MAYFVSVDNIEDLKIKYREWAVKLHPDNNGDTAEFQKMQQEFFKLFEELKKAHNQKVEESGKGFKKCENPERYADIINQLIGFQGLEIELCGVWLWIGGDTKPHKDKLKRLGCRFARNKKMWYYRCEEYASTFHKKSLDMSDIRAKYGSQRIGDNKLRLVI